MSEAPVPTYHLDGNIAVITHDDGKANVIGPSTIEAVHEYLDRAASEARAVVLVGRDGRFSAGFDLSVMTSSEDAMRSLVSDGAELLCTMYEHPLPIVSACTGHALAMGALLLMASDIRIGADGPFKIGLTEVAIGMPLPIFVIEFARDRLLPTAFTRATLASEIFDPTGAAQIGYLDAVVPADEVITSAMDRATVLAGYRTGAYARSKQLAHEALCVRVRATLAEDMATLSGPDA
ncbi:MAG TPA: crotonase/enoyl-CoA hydratase family protein [Acidimicrobiales bacterium]|nr:crotonase/enoyl-CoA hydratase family protein [Acidimicrobiales bacterium]